ncbi:cytochrome b [Alphaproteobacteria bacterium KMM 3653]|uniref:Cytochrome b n=1 Tax=Harenicola maris TaxID=2841044 RepID=A0AAP2CRI2_9RHOB|nr:cytochrome b [Harenicola maris]
MSSLHITNSRAGYGLIAITLHWIVAAAFITNYALIYYAQWFTEPRTEGYFGILTTHTAIGVSVLVFALIRLLSRFMQRTPDDVPGSRLEHLGAHAVHILLYIAMFAMPLTGYLGQGGSSMLFFAIEIPSFQDTWLFQTAIEGGLGISWESWEGVMDWLHKTLAPWIVGLLVLAHAGAALFHHFIRRDRVLLRMINPRN